MLDITRCPGWIARRGAGSGSTSSTRAAATWVLSLDDECARHPEFTGAKASALARAAAAGLPVLPGLVLSTAGTAALADEATRAEALRELLAAWREVAGPERALVVRSSSTAEDGATSSMAGRFQSVLDVSGWDAFIAVDEVVASATLEDGRRVPMAVLVQPMLRPRFGGVLFGADPVSGGTDRLLLSAVVGGPDQLVSGTVDGVQLRLSPAGRRLERGPGLPGLKRRHRRMLANLAARAREEFGGPQDIEWAIDGSPSGDRLILLQSRPITTLRPAAVPRGPVLGPGPVAETLPGALGPLEAELWVTPLRDGVTAALAMTGGASRRAVRRSPVVTLVDGQVAADLELLGVHRKRGLLRKLDPRPGARRLGASWRVGRLRAALPRLAGDVLADVDRALVDVPALAGLNERELVGILRAAHPYLVNLHAFEVLAGMVAPQDARTAQRTVTGAVAALHALADGRAQHLADEEILEVTPVTLALLAPRIGPPQPLPPAPAALPTIPAEGNPLLTAREALRLRARWLQELTARAAWELGRRLVAQGRLATPGAVRNLTLAELDAVLGGEVVATAMDDPRGDAAPLPAKFRLGAGGEVIAVAGRAGDGSAKGAGGGRGSGPVHHGADPPSGAVLVVRTLSPELAPVLPRLRGLIAETGSVLSHLAILARESGVPVVVGAQGATTRYPQGTIVSVDGHSGEVTVLGTQAGHAADEPAAGPAGAGAVDEQEGARS